VVIDGVYQDDSPTTRAKYLPSDWVDYNPMSWASNWYKWFKDDPLDSRGKMGWLAPFFGCWFPDGVKGRGRHSPANKPPQVL